MADYAKLNVPVSEIAGGRGRWGRITPVKARAAYPYRAIKLINEGAARGRLRRAIYGPFSAALRGSILQPGELKKRMPSNLQNLTYTTGAAIILVK